MSTTAKNIVTLKVIEDLERGLRDGSSFVYDLDETTNEDACAQQERELRKLIAYLRKELSS